MHSSSFKQENAAFQAASHTQSWMRAIPIMDVLTLRGLCASHEREPCENGWTDRDAVGCRLPDSLQFRRDLKTALFQSSYCSP